MGHFALKWSKVVRNRCSGERDYTEKYEPRIPANRTCVIANLIFGVFLRSAGISAKRASPPNRASPAHVIGPLDLLRTNSSKITFELTLA